LKFPEPERLSVEAESEETERTRPLLVVTRRVAVFIKFGVPGALPKFDEGATGGKPDRVA